MPNLTRDPLGLLWRGLASRKLTLVLLVLLALVGLLMLLFPQMPPAIQSNPIRYGRWLADMRARYGDNQEILQQLGLFDIRDSIGFRLILGALGLNALIHLAEGASRLAGMRRGRWSGPCERVQLECDHTSPEALRAALNGWAEETRGHWEMARDDEESLVVRRFPTRGLYLLLPYVGLLLALGGMVVNDWAGWQESGLVVSPGQEVSLGRAMDLALQGVQDEVSSEEPLRFVLLRDGQVIRRGRWGGEWPWRYGSYLFWETARGPSVWVRATGPDGQPVPVRSQPPRMAPGSGTELIFQDTGDEGYLIVSDLNVTFRLTYYSDAATANVEGAVVHVQALRPGETVPQWEAYVRENGSWTYQGNVFEVEHQRYALVRVSFLPGLALIIAGLLAVVISVPLLLFSSPLCGVGVEEEGGVRQAVLYYLAPALGPLDGRRLSAAQAELGVLLCD